MYGRLFVPLAAKEVRIVELAYLDEDDQPGVYTSDVRGPG